MESATQDTVEQEQHPPSKIQIYPTSSSEISPFWREKYEREAKKYWDVFYKHHQDRFFKDRHYLDKEWGQYFSGAERKVILEVGCGAGNTIFPLVALYPDIFVNACDFSPRAVDLVKMHKDFTETRVNAFVCDLTIDDLCKQIPPSSIDIVTMIFVLSAVSPEKMLLVLQNITKVLKPEGYVLFRDYATGDLAQERLTCKDQKISENFYVRGDGTRAFYFSDEFLTNLFNANGFDTQEYGLCCKQVENRSREIVMNRRWVQAVFRVKGVKSCCLSKTQNETETQQKKKTLKEPENGLEIDLSEGMMAAEMFGISPPTDEIIEYNLRDCSFKMKGLPKEYQHTCKSTGLMLWESARLMASILASNESIVRGKTVLELGCGCGGICSMVAAKSAKFVVATDGDEKALALLTQNLALNIHAAPFLPHKLIVKKLEWGNKDHIEATKQLSGGTGGFDVILGTDVTYVPEAILPLFETARELLLSSKRGLDDNDEEFKPPATLILCHVLRRVHEGSILSAASRCGFQLIDRWPMMTSTVQSQSSIVGSWFSDNKLEGYVPSTALTIMYFHVV